MQTKLIKIGNSRGIRLPKAVVESLGLHEFVQLDIEGDRLVVTRTGNPRSGWAESILGDPPPTLTVEDTDWLEMDNAGDDAEWQWQEDLPATKSGS